MQLVQAIKDNEEIKIGPGPKDTDKKIFDQILPFHSVDTGVVSRYLSTQFLASNIVGFRNLNDDSDNAVEEIIVRVLLLAEIELTNTSMSSVILLCPLRKLIVHYSGHVAFAGAGS